MSVGYTFKAPNNNYTKKFFDNIYSRVLIFGVEKKQGGPYHGQTHINLWKDFCFTTVCLIVYIHI